MISVTIFTVINVLIIGFLAQSIAKSIVTFASCMNEGLQTVAGFVFLAILVEFAAVCFFLFLLIFQPSLST
jgi:hypothetical protein